MKNSISEIASEFINKIVLLMSEGERSFVEIEATVLRETKSCAAKLISTYAECIDAEILADKIGRREMGCSIHRKGDKRTLETMLGEVSYHRTYYKKASGGYEYLTDTVLGIEERSRISGGLSLALATAAKDMSYAKSSLYASNGGISRQTVMSRVRRSKALEMTMFEKRRVPELHIDADEAHVTLCNGKKSEVPLISIYEGIESQGKRNYCKNIIHISEYGKTPDELWEQALSEVECRYDLADTKIYLHGDGAAWIQKGFEWFPTAVFVLDKYHKNKAIKMMTAGLSEDDSSIYDREIRLALSCEELRFFDELAYSLCSVNPERQEKILSAAGYLKRFVKGISICEVDPGANNGGCTEPHVSHVLSARLSSRPMAWSRKTPKHLAPVLAGTQVVLCDKAEPAPLQGPLRKAAASASKAFRKGTLGLPHPDALGKIQINGQNHETGKILKLFV